MISMITANDLFWVGSEIWEGSLAIAPKKVVV